MNANIQDAMPLHFTREAIISGEQAARVHELAKRILQEIGLEVRHPQTLERLQAEGFRVSGKRVFFEPAVVEKYVDEMRQWIASQSTANDTPDDGKLSLGVSSYSLHLHDLETDRVVPYTTERMLQKTKQIDTLTDAGVRGTPPDIPGD